MSLAAAENRYGDDRTIHHSGHVDVELDEAGRVVAVWFRCHPVPFKEHRVEPQRAEEMSRMYAGFFQRVKAIVFEALM